MKILRNLILADVGLLMTSGFGSAFYLASLPAASLAETPHETMAVLRLLGTALGGLAFVVLATTTLSPLGGDRWLARWLSAANFLIAITALLQQSTLWGVQLGWFLFLVFFAMAAGLSWAGLRPLRPGESTAELAMLRIPEDVRQALLRQVGDAAAQEERNRLARDLHDSIKQQLFSINVGTAAAQERWDHDPEGARSMLADVRRSAREAMVEMQALLHQLRPQALGSIKGLVEALREQCEALGYRSGADVTVEIGEEIPDDRLPPGAPEALFRIAQEALVNVAKHARARHVHLRLGRGQDEWIVLEVEDDGQGFHPGEEPSGMGLRNLRERAESLRGTFKIKSTPGAGTRVTVRIPLVPLLVTDPAVIEKGVRSQNVGIIGSVCLFGLYLLTTPLDDPNFLAIGMMALLVAGANWSWNRKAPADAARFWHAKHRAQAFLAFAAGSWAFYIASLSLLGSGRSLTAAGWGGVALLFLAEAGIKLARFHRQTRIRRSWPQWTWASLSRYWSVPLMIALTALLLLREPERLVVLGSKQILCAFSIGAVLVYLFTRQPREEGAAR